MAIRSLPNATRQVEQAQEVLSVWLELTKEEGESRMIAAILTLLGGVPEAMIEAEGELTRQKGSKRNG